MWAARYFTAYEIHDGGLRQVVAATPGTKYRFTIWGFSWTTENPVVDTPSTSQQMMRVGIDPTGGTDGNAASVVWGAETWTNDQFIQLSVEAVATGSKITVFTRTKANWCVARNDSFWDAGSLVAIGQGPTPVPPGQPTPKPAQPTPGGSWGVQAGTIITSTPMPDGSIVHTVHSGESCTGIAVAYNITMDALYSQNNLSNDKCRFIYPGQQLIIQGAQQPTPLPTATPGDAAVAEVTPAVVEPPKVENGIICVVGYEDANENSLREPMEAMLAGMTFQVSNGTQTIGTYTTDGIQPSYCFEEVQPGSYIVSWSGEGLTPTTDQNWTVDLASGATVTREFGAQGGGTTGSNKTGGDAPGGLPSWGIAIALALGVMVIMAGVGVVGYFFLMRRSKI
jgi:LysM repeat protein